MQKFIHHMIGIFKQQQQASADVILCRIKMHPILAASPTTKAHVSPDPRSTSSNVLHDGSKRTIARTQSAKRKT
ncbi:unnamed protein product [Dovyalis caffra]|uniref:Uncharacterized protein n=1 Tax=Dovyalis caffra TaxID=77055 RepID=A0AAV1S8E3_9ROSI|nr:unnamed protein product [Dovyalis caffra]